MRKFFLVVRAREHLVRVAEVKPLTERGRDILEELHGLTMMAVEVQESKGEQQQSKQ